MSNPTVAAIDPVVTATLKQSRWAHISFLVSLLGKGALGLLQIIGGLLLWLSPAGALNALVAQLSRMELIEDPADPFAHFVEKIVMAIPVSNESFYTVYLMIHGGLNLGLVLALLAGLVLAYPASVAALAGFIVYQLTKFAHTGDIMMVVLSVIDIVVIWLIWREWQYRHP